MAVSNLFRPAPACALEGEADILARVIENLADRDAKLVYADWLEDRHDPRGPLLRNSVIALRNGRLLPDSAGAPEPWRHLMGLSLAKAAQELMPPVNVELVLEHARPALTFRSELVADGHLPIGVSKLGGLPDVPAGFFSGAVGMQKTSVLGGAVLKRFGLIFDTANGGVYLRRRHT